MKNPKSHFPKHDTKSIEISCHTHLLKYNTKPVKTSPIVIIPIFPKYDTEQKENFQSYPFSQLQHKAERNVLSYPFSQIPQKAC